MNIHTWLGSGCASRVGAYHNQGSGDVSGSVFGRKRKAGRLAAKFLEQKVVKRWQGETVAGREVVLEIHNIADYTHLVELRAKIKDTDGVEKILQRNSKPDSVRYAITYNGDTDTLTETVYNILKHMGLEPGIPVAAGNSIKIRLNPVK